MFETRWRFFFTGGGQKARGKKNLKIEEKYKGTTPPGWSHPGDIFLFFFFDFEIFLPRAF